MALKKIQAAIVNFVQILGSCAPDTDLCGMFSPYGKARGGQLPSRSRFGGVGGVGGAANNTRGPGMMGRGWTLSRVGVGVRVGVLRCRLAATRQIQTLSKSSHFGGVGMCASRAAFSRSIVAAATVSAGLAAPALAQGFAPGMHVYSRPAGLEWGVEPTVSEDGTAIGVGYFSPTSGGPNWGVTITPSAVTQFPEQSRVYDIADGGAYTVGFASRRSAAGVTDVIIPGATRPSGSEVRTSISGDGSVVAGTLEDSSFSFQAAYRWTEQSGLQYLGGYRPNAGFTRVHTVSRDGETIVGEGRMSLFGNGEAWKWNQASGFSILPDLPDSRPGLVSATASNADGSIIVGKTADPTFGFRGIIWRNNEIIALPAISGWRSAIATDLSDDGAIIVGSLSSSLVGLPETAAIWTQATNWVPALDYFRTQGVDIPAYYSPQFSRFTVSADGTTFSSLLTDTRTNEQILAVVVIPGPSALAPLGMYLLIGRRSRGRRRV